MTVDLNQLFGVNKKSLSTNNINVNRKDYQLNYLHTNVKPIGEIEEELATKTESILGFKPSSKIKRGPIGILISIICIVIVFRELNRSGVI